MSNFMEIPKMTRHCACCGKTFEPRPQVPDQTFCSAPDCQRARKRQWQKEKLRTDSDYQANQRAAQRAWSARNGGYWRDWRQAQQVSAEQGHTDFDWSEAPRGTPSAVAAGLAKMDVSASPRDLYWIILRPDLPGASDGSWIAEITPVAEVDRERWTRKERT